MARGPVLQRGKGSSGWLSVKQVHPPQWHGTHTVPWLLISSGFGCWVGMDRVQSLSKQHGPLPVPGSFTVAATYPPVAAHGSCTSVDSM
jgi:hypothetical protein